jgi:hypothetical protein
MAKSALLKKRSWLLLAFLAAGAMAHPSGVSKVDITIKGDTLETRVDVNHDDLFYALNFQQASRVSKSDLQGMADRIAYYFQTRLDLKFDGVSAENMRVLAWRKHGEDPSLKMDSASLSDTSIVLTLGWPVPKGAKRLEVGAKLFAELEVQPLSHMRIFYKGQEIKRKFMSLDNRMTQSLQTDSLEAAYAAVVGSASPASSGKDLKSSSPGTATSTGTPPGEREESVVGRFLWLGFTHILPEGTDHILFVLGLFFFSTLLRPLFLQVTAFTLAHSLTLGLSLLGVFSLPSRIVEPLIALSIVIVAAENIFFRKLKPSRWLIVFGFGLIHGLGFAGVLKGLGLPEGQFFKVLVSFNLGVECGQLTVIAAASALTMWMWKKPWYHRRVVVPVSAIISAVGLFWFVQRILIAQG